MVNSVLFTNNAYSTLTAAVTAVATTFSVASGEGARFPTIAGGDYFYATLIDTSNNLEIIKVTARSTDTFTITRAQEGTTAIAFAGGDRIELRLTAAGIDDRKDSTETLTNKTITSPDINGGTLDGAVIGGASAAAGTFTTIVANTSLALASGAVVTAILDEDAMGSDSATALATQQSIKAYVDAQVTASDLDFAGDSGTGAVDLDSQTFTLAGGNGITSVGGSQTITFNLDASNTTQTSLANLVTVGALNSGSISSGFGNIDIGSSTLSATGTITGPSGTWDSGGMDIAASDSYAVAGTAILSDAAGTMMLSNIDALDATTEATIEAAIDTLSNLTTVGALNSGSITSGFGNIDIGSSTFTTTGTLAAGATTLSGDLTVTGNFLYGAAATTTTFLSTTSDAADSGALQISGGGGVGDTRGAYFSLHGNEHANVGDIHYVAGTSGQHEFYNASSVITLTLKTDHSATFAGDVEILKAAGGELHIQTTETTVVDTNRIGVIEFNAPLDSAGGDALLVGARIEAVATATFSSSVNTTDIVFGVGNSEDAVEKLRIAGDTGNTIVGKAAGAGESPWLVFGTEDNNARKGIRITSYFLEIQGHENEGVKIVSTDASATYEDMAVFYGNNNAASREIHFWPGGSGKVGINNTSPGVALDVTGDITASGDLTVTGNFLYGAAATTTTFLNTSSDAADSGALQISGAGGVGDTRGSYFSLHGNEHANVGDIHYVAGTSGQHEFYNGSSVLSLAISSAGNFDFQDGTVTTTGTLTAGATTITGQGTVSADFGVGTTDILNSIGGVISPGVTGAEIAGSAVSLALDGTSSADFYMADSGAAADNKVVDLSFDGGVFSLRGINDANGVEDTAFSYTISTGAIDFTDTTLTTTGAAALGDTTITGTIGVTDSQGADLPLITATNTSAASYTQGFHAIFPNITAGPTTGGYIVGQDWSSKNAGRIGFIWNSSGSDSNALEFGFHSADGVLLLYPTGAATLAGALTLTSGQIKFPITQVPSADAKTLDDYEESTFTPVVEYGGTPVTSYHNQYGRYTKIGNVVFFQIEVQINVIGTTGDLTITIDDIEHTPSASNKKALAVWYDQLALAASGSVVAEINDANEFISLYEPATDGDTNGNELTHTTAPSSAQFVINGHYFV